MKEESQLKVAIVHDWLIGGGAERVVLALHQMFPDAPIYTSYCTDEWRQQLDDKVVTGYLQKGPFPKLRKFLPVLRAMWFSSLKLDNYDLVISSSGAEAKAVKTSKNTLHVNYCHSPTHYYWVRYDEYMQNPGFGAFDWLARIGLRLLIGPMRRWDYRAAQRPDVMIANSTYTQANIKKYYGRDSVVIHPPVDVERFAQTNKTTPPMQADVVQGENENREGDVQTSTSTATRSSQHSNTSVNTSSVTGSAGQQAGVVHRAGLVTAGRQTPYMRKDLAIVACNELKLPLNVIGKGPEHDKLVKMAGPSIKFMTGVTDDEIPELFQQAEAFILPGKEDFGITAVEAMAAGTPIVAFKAGGSLDYVIPGKTGIFFEVQSTGSLVAALSLLKSSKFDSAFVKQQAYNYRPEVFKEKFQALLDQKLTKA